MVLHYICFVSFCSCQSLTVSVSLKNVCICLINNKKKTKKTRDEWGPWVTKRYSMMGHAKMYISLFLLWEFLYIRITRLLILL